MNGRKLFRGKDSNGNWVEGSFLDLDDGKFIVVSTSKDSKEEWWSSVKVDPSTVEQLINSRTDIHGKELWEGDIVKIYWHCSFDRSLLLYGVMVDENSIIEDGLGRHFPQDTKDYEVIGNVVDGMDILDERTQNWVKHYLFEGKR